MKTCIAHGFCMGQTMKSHAQSMSSPGQTLDIQAVQAIKSLLQAVNNWLKYTCKRPLSGYNRIKFS